MNEDTGPADEKSLALYYAYVALVKTLADAGHLDTDALFANLAGANQQLQKIGEDGAAKFLGEMCRNMTAI
jgi:hypothetical protein